MNSLIIYLIGVVIVFGLLLILWGSNVFKIQELISIKNFFLVGVIGILLLWSISFPVTIIVIFFIVLFLFFNRKKFKDKK